MMTRQVSVKDFDFYWLSFESVDLKNVISFCSFHVFRKMFNDLQESKSLESNGTTMEGERL
jgi:hypothetical protein